MNITVQISQLQSEISRLNENVATNNQNITRLENAKSKILVDQDELSMEKNMINQPQLSNETWVGKHATDFLDIRKDINNTYNDMMINQVDVLLENIDQAIKNLKAVNLNLTDSIESNKYRIHKLRELEDD